MKCSSCGKDLLTSRDIKYCIHCGNPLFRECPDCGNTIPSGDKVCRFCKLDITKYEKAVKLLSDGKLFEEKWKYEEAKELYKRARDIISRDEISKLLNGVTQKIKTIKDNQLKAESLIKAGGIQSSGKLKSAKRALQEVQSLLPEDEDTSIKLSLIETRLKSRSRKIRFLLTVIIILAGVGIFYTYTNTLSSLALRGLKSLLSSSEMDIKHSSALILGWRGERCAGPTLEMLVNSSDERKRIYSLSALLKLGEVQTLPILRDVMRTGSISTRIGAAWTLGAVGDSTIAPELATYLSEEGERFNPEDLKIASAVILLNLGGIQSFGGIQSLGYSVAMPVIEESLKSKSEKTRFKVLYALYLLGSKEVLQLSVGTNSIRACLRDLLKDKSKEISLLSALLLKEFSPKLSPEDSALIGGALWNGFIMSELQILPSRVEEMPVIRPFYVARGIIKGEGYEDILSRFIGISPLTSEIRKKCVATLSRIELGDELVMEELTKALNSVDKYERLYSALVMLKFDKRKAIPVLKELMKDKDELLKLNTCTLTLEFTRD